MRQAWNRLGPPDAISWVVALLASIQLVAGSLAAPFVDVTGRLGEFFVARLLSLVGLLLVLAAGKALMNVLAKHKPQPLLTLLTFAAATVVVTTSMNWLLIITGFTAEWNVARRIIVAIPGFFTIMIISALLVVYARESSRRNEELAKTVSELVATRRDAAERIQNRKHSLIESIKSEMSYALADIETAPEDKTSESLKTLIDDVVRPMSYRLSRDLMAHSMREIVVTQPKVAWWQIVRDAMGGNPAHPIATGVWIGLLLGAFLATGFGVSGLIAAVAFMFIATFTLLVTRWLWPHLPRALPAWARALVFSMVVALYSLISAETNRLITGYDFLAPHVIVGWFMLCLSMTSTVTLVYTINTRLRDTYRNLSRTAEELKREVIQLNNELRVLQKNISRVLHGPVQEAITASLYRMQSAGKNSTAPNKPDAGLKEEIQQRIEEALQQLEEPTVNSANLQKSLDDLVELWDEVVRIEIEIDDSEKQRIQSDPYAANILIELIREACGNAIRHGQANIIRVSTHIPDSGDSVHLYVENDGRPLCDSAKPGLGSQIFDEMCLDWSRTQHDSIVRLDARIPLTV